MTTGVLLVNLGTPHSPQRGDVKRYLTQFLMDKRVIDLPLISRCLLVRVLIVPRRYKESAKLYRSVWNKEGSPLLVYGQKLQSRLQKKLGSRYQVELAMRYQSPSIKRGLKRLKGVDRLVIFPLFSSLCIGNNGVDI